MVVINEIEVSLVLMDQSIRPISERSKQRVVLHIVCYLFEVIKRFSKEDHRDIISRVLYRQNLNEHTKNIRFRDSRVHGVILRLSERGRECK